MAARDLLAKDGIRAAVVSMPCWELFEAQAEEYRTPVLGTAPRVAVEAGGAARLGPLARRALGLCRHERFRRLGPGRGALPAFRHHRREGCGGGPLASIAEPTSFARRNAMAIRVAINGFGRIGRLVLRAALEHASREIEIVGDQRSRPGRDQRAPACATTACTAALPARSRPATTGWMPAAARSASPPSATRRSCRGRSSASTSRSNAPASSPSARPPRSISKPAPRRSSSRPRPTASTSPCVMGVNHDELTRRAQGHLERVVHDQLPRAGRLCAAPGHRHRARLYDDDPLLYRRPEPAGHAAQRSAPRPRRGAVADPDLDRRGARGRARAAGAQGQARRHRDPRADRQRVADRLHVRRGARDHRRRGQRADGRRGEVEPAAAASSASTRRRPSRSTSTTTRTARPST